MNIGCAHSKGTAFVSCRRRIGSLEVPYPCSEYGQQEQYWWSRLKHASIEGDDDE